MSSIVVLFQKMFCVHITLTAVFAAQYGKWAGAVVSDTLVTSASKRIICGVLTFLNWYARVSVSLFSTFHDLNVLGSKLPERPVIRVSLQLAH